ncbi:MAG: thioredoxin domain-containing protein [Thermomicrobium sp.]|nr:thioredoxin domain-containing protein [Thermomicrobium sp.]
MSNRLANEKSLYLRQHADNPVDWYPWGEEAFRVAREQDKPILLSIGYSSCHWCHVMEHECFENPEIAALQNELFVNIKVDREERPDLDELYMNAVQAMTGSGGWPLNVFLTPDGKPFYGGTYFPPEDRGQLPAWPRVLVAVAHAYRERREEVQRAAEDLVQYLHQQTRPPLTPEALREQFLDEAARNLVPQYDRVHGGFGQAPKFPAPLQLEFLLRTYRRAGAPRALEMVLQSLAAMARGGLHDQVGGGFHRYTVDDAWLIPHFEKMLYDNALLARVYTQAYLASGAAWCRRVAEDTLGYLLREMRGAHGAFFSAQDADSEGGEGAYYLWTLDEIEALLPPDDAQLVRRYYGATPQGNFEGMSILHIPDDPEAIAAEFGLSLDELDERIRQARAVLFEARSRRPAPAHDEKVIVAWNGLAIRAFAEAATAFDRPDYAQVAAEAATFVRQHLWDGTRLSHVWEESEPRFPGFLDDYADLANGLISLYEATFDPAWIAWARELAEVVLERFLDPETGDFFDTPEDGEPLIVRPKTFVDQGTPSGNGAAAEALLRLGTLLGERRYLDRATHVLERYARIAVEHPIACGQLLVAMDFALGRPFEIAIVGTPEDTRTQALLRVVYGNYLPNRVLALRRPGDEEAPRIVPLLAGREAIDGQPTAYVCREFVCQRPVTTPQELASQLGVADAGN